MGPGGGEPPHVQHREDECLCVLEGRFGVLIEDGRSEAVPGSVIYVPKGTLHAYENAGDGTGRLLVVHTPGGPHERFLAEVGEGIAHGTASPDPERLASVAARYGIEVCKTTPSRETKTERQRKESAR